MIDNEFAYDPLVDGALLVARILIALMFLASAADKFKGSPQQVAMIAKLGFPAPERLERLTGVFELAAALALIFGAGTRIAAVCLALFVAFLSFAFLRYWSFDGPAEARQVLRSGFFVNWAAVGGLILLAAMGPGQIALIPT